MSFPYSTRHHPPIPALEIALRSPEGGTSVGPLLALVDTGADGTVIPTEYLEQLSLSAMIGRACEDNGMKVIGFVCIWPMCASVGYGYWVWKLKMHMGMIFC